MFSKTTQETALSYKKLILLNTKISWNQHIKNTNNVWSSRWKWEQPLGTYICPPRKHDTSFKGYALLRSHLELQEVCDRYNWYTYNQESKKHLKIKYSGKVENDAWSLSGMDLWVFEEAELSRKHMMGKRLDHGMGWVDWNDPLILRWFPYSSPQKRHLYFINMREFGPNKQTRPACRAEGHDKKITTQVWLCVLKYCVYWHVIVHNSGRQGTTYSTITSGFFSSQAIKLQSMHKHIETNKPPSIILILYLLTNIASSFGGCNILLHRDLLTLILITEQYFCHWAFASLKSKHFRQKT